MHYCTILVFKVLKIWETNGISSSIQPIAPDKRWQQTGCKKEFIMADLVCLDTDHSEGKGYCSIPNKTM